MPLIHRYRQLPPDCEEAQKLAARIAVNIGDSDTRHRILKGEISSSIDDKDTKKERFSTIDAFLDKFGTNIKPAGYVPDESPDVIISEETNDNQEEKISFSELIKNHRYEEALQLIESQNLNNPQKSIYFAHQMRFLKKLIAIENKRKTTEG